MKSFLSWSGEHSRNFAEEFKPWLEQVLPGTDVWLSSEDIDKGTIWFTAIIGELETCHCGILCITRENYLSPWIHFEAGGMVKGLGKNHVATILLDIDYPELKPPLNQFNGTRLNRQGAWHLVKSLNKLSDRPIKDHVLERTFEKFWPDLDEAYRLLFPTSYEVARNVSQPVFIAPAPAETLLGAAPAVKPKRRKSQPDSETQPGLFNGVKE
jgi:TIR domain